MQLWFFPGAGVPDDVEGFFGQGGLVVDEDLVHVLVVAPGHEHVLETAVGAVHPVFRPLKKIAKNQSIFFGEKGKWHFACFPFLAGNLLLLFPKNVHRQTRFHEKCESS